MSLDTLGCSRDTMVATTGCEVARRSKSFKSNPSPDWSLQFDSMKLKSLVIADQNAAVNMFSSLVLTARQVRGVESTQCPVLYGPKVSSVTRAKA